MKTINVVHITEIPENILAWSLDALENIQKHPYPYLPWGLLDSQKEDFEPIDHFIAQKYPELVNTEFILSLVDNGEDWDGEVVE